MLSKLASCAQRMAMFKQKTIFFLIGYGLALVGVLPCDKYCVFKDSSCDICMRMLTLRLIYLPGCNIIVKRAHFR